MAILTKGNPRVQTSEDGYKIAVGDETSAEFDFGTPAEHVTPDGRRFIALVDLPEGATEGAEVESQFEYWLYEATPIDTEPEEVDGDGDDEDEEEGVEGGELEDEEDDDGAPE